ncbi:MAG: DUF5681 domain-containing protein [Halioglobus sp.]
MFKKGQSGNPSGRPKMPVEVREAIRSNGELAVNRMTQLLSDESAWGQSGWIKPREQILLATAAQERAFGKVHSVAVDHLHGGSIDLTAKQASISDRLASVADQLPERKVRPLPADTEVVELETPVRRKIRCR